MANTDVRIKIEVEGSESSVQKIRNVENAVGGSSGTGGLVRAFTLGNLAASAITTGVKLAADAMRGLTNMAFDTGKEALAMAGKFQQTSVSFEALIGNAELSKKTLMDLRDFSLSTPFGFEEITDASKRLLAYGVAAEELVPTMEMLGNITAAVGTDKMPQLILAYGQVRAATRLTGMELRQFTETGVPMLAALAESMNVPIESIQKMVSEGKVGFGDVQKALQLLTGEGGKYSELMEKQSKTMYGVQEKLSDMWKMFLGVIGGTGVDLETIPGGLLDVIVTKGNEILDWILAHKDEIINFLTNVSTKLGEWVTGVVNFAREAGSKIQGFVDENKPKLDNFFSGFTTGADESSGEVETSLNDLQKEVDKTNDSWREMVRLIKIAFGRDPDKPTDWNNIGENLGIGLNTVKIVLTEIAQLALNVVRVFELWALYLYKLGLKFDEYKLKVLIGLAEIAGLNTDTLQESLRVNQEILKGTNETIKSEEQKLGDYINQTAEKVRNKVLEMKAENEKALNSVTATAGGSGQKAGETFGEAIKEGVKLKRNVILDTVVAILRSIKVDVGAGQGGGVGLRPHYATGGIVPGTSYTGDRVIIGANSGEMVLNKDQQSNLFNFLRNLSAAPRNINFGNVSFGGGERSPLQEQNMFMNLLVNAV